MAKAKAWVVFKREYLERLRSRWFVISTLLGPLFLALITVVPIIMASKTHTSSTLSDVIIIDATGTDLGKRVAGALLDASPAAPVARVRVVKAEQVAAAETRATHEVMDHAAQGYIVLDANTLAGRDLRYAGRNATSLIDVQTITRITQQSLLEQRLEREGINPGRVGALTAIKLDAKTEKITDQGKEGASGLSSFFFAWLIVLVLYMMIALYGQNIMRGVIDEKTNRVAEVIVSSVKPDTLLAGKIIGSGMVAVTQVCCWLVMSFLIYQVRTPLLARFGVPMAGAALKIPTVPPLIGLALFVFFVLGFILYAALFGAVGAMVSNQEDVQQAMMPVMLLLITSLIFMQPILLNPSSTLAKTMSWLPFSAPLMMPLRMALIAIPWYEIVGAMLSVLIGTAIAIWLAARIYRVGLLMYGKRPSLRELGRWIRMA
jgi:ABC-2 type transport system permease protein